MATYIHYTQEQKDRARTTNLVDLLERQEPLDEFDDKLFEEIIVEMSINNRDELTITLLGGLKFTELI